MLVVFAAASRYSSTAASRSPARSSRCARTASRRWLPRSRSSSSSGASNSSPASRTVHHRRRDRVVERDHRIVGHPLRARRTARGSAASRCPRRAPLRRAPPRSPPAADTRRPILSTSAALASATPSAMACRSQSVRSCSSSGINSPSGPGARRAAGVGQEHQREQAGHVAVVGQELMDLAHQADRFVRQIGAMQLGSRARRVALVEDQVQHVQHRAQPLRPLLGVGHAERDARGLDALLGAADALRRSSTRARETPSRSRPS